MSKITQINPSIAKLRRMTHSVINATHKNEFAIDSINKVLDYLIDDLVAQCNRTVSGQRVSDPIQATVYNNLTIIVDYLTGTRKIVEPANDARSKPRVSNGLLTRIVPRVTEATKDKLGTSVIGIGAIKCYRSPTTYGKLNMGGDLAFLPMTEGYGVNMLSYSAETVDCLPMTRDCTTSTQDVVNEFLMAGTIILKLSALGRLRRCGLTTFANATYERLNRILQNVYINLHKKGKFVGPFTLSVDGTYSKTSKMFSGWGINIDEILFRELSNIVDVTVVRSLVSTKGQVSKSMSRQTIVHRLQPIISVPWDITATTPSTVSHNTDYTEDMINDGFMTLAGDNPTIVIDMLNNQYKLHRVTDGGYKLVATAF